MPMLLACEGMHDGSLPATTGAHMPGQGHGVIRCSAAYGREGFGKCLPYLAAVDS
jgi:hypothetical protein